MQELDYESVEDLGRFVILVDVTDKETRAINLVQSQTQAPAIGSVQSGAYICPPLPAGAEVPDTNLVDIRRIPQYQTFPYVQQPRPNGQATHNGYSPSGTGYAPRPAHQASAQSSYHPSQAPPSNYTNQQYNNQQQHQPANPPPPPINQFTAGGVTRNLIGATTSTAFRLTDENGQTGLWFIFQDLSIRTEGTFRLRFDLYDLSADQAADAPPQAGSKAATAPQVASIHSRPFKVWSAKKFPGVIETTKLSRAFAEQGIKIPVRKNDEKKRKRANAAGKEEGDSDSDY
jgi:hypothetical protein